MRQIDRPEDGMTTGGKPIRPQSDTPDEWVVVDPRRPDIQRNVKTGMWRNVKPPPPPVPWFTLRKLP